MPYLLLPALLLLLLLAFLSLTLFALLMWGSCSEPAVEMESGWNHFAADALYAPLPALRQVSLVML